MDEHIQLHRFEVDVTEDTQIEHHTNFLHRMKRFGLRFDVRNFAGKQSRFLNKDYVRVLPAFVITPLQTRSAISHDPGTTRV